MKNRILAQEHWDAKKKVRRHLRMIEKESFGTFSEQNSVENEPAWVNTYYHRQEISNPLIDFCVFVVV